MMTIVSRFGVETRYEVQFDDDNGYLFRLLQLKPTVISDSGVRLRRKGERDQLLIEREKRKRSKKREGVGRK
uniref:Uncharacterized protein n=1 Tax=Nelumbo nucifera TaxID=4432 RepID=A0A822XX20_NELNU|nr:TPA_asm: hypothetical protein HUJ06_026026 [Nelumbo nucifera]